MFCRAQKLSDSSSFFLFGARGTGKTTFLKQEFGAEAIRQSCLWIDLLRADEERKYARDPDVLEEEVKAAKPLQWVVIDEVQKLPKLLDVVHRLVETTSTKFALTGSSARKLKRGAANLLAGRAFVYYMFPFIHRELGSEFQLMNALRWGTLPGLFEFDTDLDRERFLDAYANTYVREEILIEQLVRNVHPFRAFLEIAAQLNTEPVSYSKISRQIGVDAKTVTNYFDILEDTLLGFRLPAFCHSVRKQQQQAPKFYFVDMGIVSALSRTTQIPLTEGTYAYGRAFEHFIVNEIVRLNHYGYRKYRLSYLRSKDGAEIDLVLERPGMPTALVEIKSATRVDSPGLRNLQSYQKDIPNSVAYCLCLEKRPRKVDNVTLLPWQQGLVELGL